MPPSSRNEAAGSIAWNDNMATTGQANLTPVRVPAQLMSAVTSKCTTCGHFKVHHL